MTEETIFQEALAKSAEKRALFLDQACSGQPQLRAAVEALLAAHEKPDNLLDKPPGNLAATLDSQPAGADSAATGEHTPSPIVSLESRASQTATTDFRRNAVAGVVIGGRYTLQEKIGEGGMGEVWVAKQTQPVKRKVALKLIKTGMDSRAVLQRFEQERQALALMDHPNIARVLDGGMTPTGQPFFVMELVNGLPLNKFCDELKLTPKARLELFVPICQAVQHAHQKGIVHRDLKPANILVTMIDGKPVPKVIDFGVAKATSGKLTEETMSTGFGAVVGTLEYMSPEQAGFSGEDIDTRADIYSLGVILYELLTGLRPIDAKRLKKAALTEMIRIIQEEEPSKPSTRLSTDESLPSLAAVRQTEPKKLMALLRGELDWVVMKCLEKQRDRRYDTANALVRDIQRYLADEVVEARPPSAGYRLQKFVRRNRGQVIATSLVLVALFAGIVGTTLGLLQALDKEAAAVLARNQLATKNTALELSEAEVENKNKILEQKQDRLEESLARTWLSPLAESPGPLNNAEIDALNELAIFRNDPLADRFMTEALLNNQGKRKLRARSRFAFQAVVGLDVQRHQEVEQLLVNSLKSADQSEEARTNIMVAAWEWGELSPSAAAVVAQAQFQALREMKDPVNFGTQIRVLGEVLNRMEPKEAARLSAEAAVTFVRDIDTTKDAYLLSAPLTCLGSVAAHLEPKEAAAAATTLTAAMAKSDDVAVKIFLSQGLLAVAARLEPKEAAALAATLVEAMAEMKSDSPSLQPLTRVLSAVAARMESKEAVATLARAISKTNNEFELNGLAKSLAAVAAHLKPKEATRVCTEAAAVLIQAMTMIEHSFELELLSEGLLALTARMEPAEAARVSTEAAAAIKRIDRRELDESSVMQVLSAIAARMESKTAVVTLTQAISETSQHGSLAAALSTAVEQLEPKEATRVCSEAAAVLIQAMTMADSSGTLAFRAQSLSAVVARLEPKEAGEVAAILAQTIAKTNSSMKLAYLAQVLSAVPARLEPNDAKAVAAAFTLAMAETMGMDDEPASRRLVILAKSLPAVAARMEPKAAALVSTEAAISLIQTMTKPQNPQTLMILAESLSLLTPRMAPPDAARVSTEAAAVLTQAIAKEPGAYDDVRDLVKGLSFVAPRMEPKAAATAAAMLTRNLVDPQKNLFSLGYLAEGLSAVAPRLGPQEASNLADILTQSKLVNPILLAEPLSALAARMESTEAVALLTQTMTKIADANTRANIIDNADTRDNANAIKSLAEGLSAVSARMEPKEAVDAAATLTQTIEAFVRVANFDLKGNEIGVNATTLVSLVESLSAVSDRMEPDAAARVSAESAAMLTQAMAKTSASEGSQPLAQGLATVLGDSQRRRLSDQQLVELLKLPFCVGPARRTILDQLELRYRRKFADQWEFVRFAEEQRIRLDFTTPPQRR